MKKDLRIVFMGTPEFAVTTLKGILEANYNVVGVITAPDKPAGRGRKLNASAVKKFAESQNLRILQPTNLKDEAFLEDLKSLNANIQVVVAFRMLPKAVWQMPEYGTFNLHASLLPDYRGAAPINWAVINGETKTGVTTFFIDEKIDTGAMILQEEIAIEDDETVGMLHDKLMTIGSKLVTDTLNGIEEDSITTTIQPKTAIEKKAPKLNKDNCKIDWNDSLKNIYNKVRGLNPYPGAWTTLYNNGDEVTMKVYGCSYTLKKHKAEIGSIYVSNKELNVMAPNGYITINEIQLPGKRKMDVKSLLNGYNFAKDAKVL